MVDRESDNPALEGSRFSPRAFLVRDWPYLAMLALALFGVAYTSVARHAMTTYWMVLVPFFGAICVAVGWRELEPGQPRWRLARTQTLHWLAVAFAMYLVFAASVKEMMNIDASALMVLILLALGTFTAGVQIAAWRICLVGVVLALAIPAIAWLEQATLLLVLAAMALATLAVLLFSHGTRKIAKNAEPSV